MYLSRAYFPLQRMIINFHCKNYHKNSITRLSSKKDILESKDTVLAKTSELLIFFSFCIRTKLICGNYLETYRGTRPQIENSSMVWALSQAEVPTAPSSDKGLKIGFPTT